MSGMKGYDVEVRVALQEDGLWRAEVPGLGGWFVDADTVAQALTDIQSVVAMYIDLYDEEDRALPNSVRPLKEGPLEAALPVVVGEHRFRRRHRGAPSGSNSV
jgi:predicted RNase H-like HicB family nuclease